MEDGRCCLCAQGGPRQTWPCSQSPAAHPSRASIFSRTVRAGPRLPRSMALITAPPGSGLQHPHPPGAGVGGWGGARGPALRAALPGCRPVPSAGRPGQGRARAGLALGSVQATRGGQPQWSPSVLPPHGARPPHTQNGEGLWRPFRGTLGGQRQAAARAGCVPKQQQGKCPVEVRTPALCWLEREGQARPFLEPSSCPSSQLPRGCQSPPSSLLRGSGWYWHRLCPGQWH